MHDGKISAHSEGKGQGATFKVVLPLVAHKDKEELVEHRPTSRRGLLVEDHGDTAMMMQALLESAGHRVEAVGDVAQALGAATARKYDILISDLGLPDGSGQELMEELRRRGNPLKGIALSGFGREEDVRRSKEAGFTEHLTKPTEFDVLTAAVERVTKS